MSAENAVGVVYARELKKAENPEELRAKYLEKVQQIVPGEAGEVSLQDLALSVRACRHNHPACRIHQKDFVELVPRYQRGSRRL